MPTFFMYFCLLTLLTFFQAVLANSDTPSDCKVSLWSPLKALSCISGDEIFLSLLIVLFTGVVIYYLHSSNIALQDLRRDNLQLNRLVHDLRRQRNSARSRRASSLPREIIDLTGSTR